MGRPRQVSDEEILSTARRVFLDQGTSVSTTVIAEQLGISQAALFKRFKTKKILVFSALSIRSEPPFVELLKEQPSSDGARAQLLRICLEISRYFEELMPCMMALRASGYNMSEVFADHVIPPPVLARNMLSQWLRAAQKVGLIVTTDADATATAWLGALQLRPFLSHISRTPVSDSDTESYANHLTNLLLNGLLPSEDS